MTTDNLTATLTALLDHWNTLAQDAAERVKAPPPILDSECMIRKWTGYNQLYV